jgi:O-antigen/teichoic acid export membrane protein
MRAMPAETASPAVAGEKRPERPLAPDVLMTFGNKVGVLVLTLASTVVVARTLGPSGRGAVAVALSFSLLLIQFGSFGLQSANPYFAARDPAAIPRVIANAVWMSISLGLALALAGAAVKALFPAALRGLDWLDMVVVLAAIPALLANTLLQSVLLAEGRMRAYNGVEFGLAVCTFVGLTLGLAVFGIGVLGALAVLMGLNVAGSITYFLLLRVHGPPISRPDRALLSAMLRYGFRVYVATVIAYGVGRINLIFVNSYLGSAAAGQYSIGIALAEGMHILPSVVALNLFPRIARGDPHERSAAVFRTLSLLFALLCLITVPLVAPGIQLLFGHAFSGAVVLYYWLLPGIFAYGMLNVLSYHFAGRGFPLEAVLVWVPGLALNLVLVAVFLPGHSASVAALAATISYVVVLALHMRLFAKESGGYASLIPRPREAFDIAAAMIRDLRPKTA